MSDGLARFTARFDSECGHCDSAMYEGDLIAFVKSEGIYICEDCFDDFLE